MSELRAPDPTLTALGIDAGVAISFADVRPMAHRTASTGKPACGAEVGVSYRAAEHARWYAVPCRECFPDAPRPGERTCTCLLGPPISRGVLHYHPDPDLAWQVPS